MHLAERFAMFLPAAWRGRVAACGGTVHEVGGLAVCLTGVPVAEFNPTLVEGLVHDPATAIAEAERRYPPEVGFGMDLDPSRDADVLNAAVAAGLVMLERRPAMAVHVADLRVPPDPDGVQLVRVTDPRLLDEVVRVDALAFGGDPAMTRRFLPDAVLDDPRNRVYAAFADGEVVAAAESALAGGAIGVFGVATDPAYRRRGIGAAMTALSVVDRRDEADLAVLESSDIGYGVYERLGFRTVATREIWVRHASG